MLAPAVLALNVLALVAVLTLVNVPVAGQVFSAPTSHQVRGRSKMPVCHYFHMALGIPSGHAVSYGIYWYTGTFDPPTHYGLKCKVLKLKLDS